MSRRKTLHHYCGMVAFLVGYYNSRFDTSRPQFRMVTTFEH